LGHAEVAPTSPVVPPLGLAKAPGSLGVRLDSMGLSSCGRHTIPFTAFLEPEAPITEQIKLVKMPKRARWSNLIAWWPGICGWVRVCPRGTYGKSAKNATRYRQSIGLWGPWLPFPILNKLIRFNGQRPFSRSLLSNAKGVPRRTIGGQGLVRVHTVVAVWQS